MTARTFIIAIDGPSGAGKGTVAHTIARLLNFRHIDTGAMYRAVAWKARHDRIDLEDAEAVARVADRAEFDLELEGRVAIDGFDVTTAIRTAEMDDAAAIVARHPQVRAALVQRQRRYGHDGGVVMEGRDIGTVVFPDARVKLYLDATPAERARRRAQDQAHGVSHEGAGVTRVAEALEARDHSDRTRAASPLTCADDAVYIDTTGVPIDDVVRRVMAVVEARLGA